MAPPSSVSKHNEMVSIQTNVVKLRIPNWVIFPLLMDEQTTDTTRAGIEIFVRAPHREVDVPIMQREWHVPNGMCEIPSAYASL